MFIIACPNCKQPLRLPPEMLGTTTTCPHCKCYFAAPSQNADGTLTAPRFMRRNPFAKSRAIMPGALLILFGIFTLFINGTQVLRAWTDRKQFEERNQAFFGQITERMEQQAKEREEEQLKKRKEGKAKDEGEPVNVEEQRQEIQDWLKTTNELLPVLSIVFAVQSLVTLIGGVCMVRRRSHVMALFGAFAAMFHFAYFCCAAGIPIGGLALFVLFNPQVRAEFLANKPKSEPTPNTPAPPTQG